VLQFLRRFKNHIVSAICLALPFFFLNANIKKPSELNSFDRILLQVSAPLQSALDAVARATADALQSYVFLWRVRRDVERLRYENARLREENHRFQRAEIENRRLRRMLEFRETFEGELRTARVIAKERNAVTHRVIRISIDRGLRDQVRPGMPVVTHGALVGEIRRAAAEYADVLLVVDSASAVSAVVERTGAYGILRGTGEVDRYAIRIEHLDSEHEVRVGDLVHTSGEDRKFPAGLLVGRISQLRRSRRALHQEAEVKPAVDCTRLQEVSVIVKSRGGEPNIAAASESRGSPARSHSWASASPCCSSSRPSTTWFPWSARRWTWPFHCYSRWVFPTRPPHGARRSPS